MAPRLSKRLQREQEELQALAAPSKLHDDSDSEGESEEERVPMNNRGVSGFAALAGDGEEEEEPEPISEDDKPKASAKSKKSKKKKKKGATSYEHDKTAAPAPPTPQTKIPKRKMPKENAKPRSKLKAEEDDFEKALSELSGKYTNSGNSTPAKTSAPVSSFDSFNSLLSVSLKNLDPETELRRFFGSKVISSSAPSPRASRTSASLRSHLARPQQTWPPAHYRAGLSMRALTSDEVYAKGTGAGPDIRERWWTIEAGPRYKGTTYEYMQCVMGGDPQLFFNLLREMPWHADTLLQTAEVFRHREEYSSAADFLSRALFAYERAFTGAFNLTTGIHRLDFDRVENRVFYLALSRNVVDLNRRGTPRTAFEFARLLLALDPHTDPHGALLHLEYLAIKAGQASWLLDVWNAYNGIHSNEASDIGETRFDVTMMPGWHWAKALALFETEKDQDHGASTQALLDAILAFPSIAPILADKADISMPAEMRKLDTFEIVTDWSPYRDNLATSLIHLLSHIYATRSASLWKAPPRAAWLSKTLASFTTTTVAESTPLARTRLCALLSEQSNLTDAIYRHIAVVTPLAPEFRRLTSFFPPQVKERLGKTIEGDPLPPVTAVSVYNDGYFTAAGVEGRSHAGDGLETVLDRLFPNAVDRRQFQAMFDAHPEIGARFPGGFAELAQLVRQFPQEVLEAMVGMIGENEDHPAEEPGEGVMPGWEPGLAEHMEPEDLPAMQVEGEGAGEPQEEGDDDDDENEQPFLPVRIVRTLLGRLWGRSAQVDSDSDRDEEERVQEEDTNYGARADDVD